MANFKAIVIDVESKSVPNGVEESWQDITTHMPILTRDIKTPALDKNSDLTSVVSGMPTVFARANLFKLAIDYIQSDIINGDAEGLMNFYGNLVDEWRGFIACLALDYTRIEVKRIKLAYSDGKSIADTSNIYEPKGAFGNLLFERKALWSLQGVAANEDSAPFIDVILYEANKQGERNVIGGVSPESLLFTSPSYKISSDRCFVNRATRKFTDPLKSAMTQDEALTLLAYVEHVENKLNSLENYYSNLSADIAPNYSTIQGNIRNWKEDIKKYCNDKGFDLDSKSIPPVDKFAEPYNLVFNYSSNLWGLDGIIYDDESLAPENKILFDPKKVLLPKQSEIARIDLNNKVPLEEQPIYVLKAEIKGKENEYAYFALPITPLGLNVFGKNIGALTRIDNGNAIRSKLTAVYDQDMPVDNLEVSLEIITQSGKRKTVNESYTVGKDRISNKDILIWPNFVADQWNRYFMYSEMPHNTVSQSCPFKATPIVGSYENNDFRIIVDDNTKEPIVLAQSEKITIPDHIKDQFGLRARFHVVSDNRVSDNDYKYEIYESSLPFKGVKLSSGNKESGYIVIRYTTSNSATLPKNKLGLPLNLQNATVGIDFGSTNTSVAYEVGQELHNIHFKNHRTSLLQAGYRSTCRERDLFFFQSKEIEGNSIKSILSTHDQRRFVPSDYDALGKEVSGGMPCFDPSLLPVETVTNNRILLSCPSIGPVQLVHNMKWTTQKDDISNKKAFLRSLMLHIYAQLFDQDCVPTKLKWSYPSAMGDQLINQYSQIWKDLNKDLSPVENNSLTVCDSDISVSIPTGEGGWGVENKAGSDGWGNLGQSQGNWDTNNQSQSMGQQGNNSGWGEQDNNSGWDQQGSNSGWNQDPVSNNWNSATSNAPSVDDLEPDNNEVEFEFTPVDSAKCLTEACAVANFMMTQNINMTNRSLTLCFDVGGSTTDISALLLMPEGLTMIKQNSIKFAAQRVSEAAKYEPELKRVLLDICYKNKIMIPGLNLGPDKYSSETASFYFEQVLDRIDANCLPDLYSAISANCPKLMAVNLYVTGLIVYYAGQISNKLIKVIRASLGKKIPFYANFTPNINVMFAGKGARIFEWFSTTQHSAANSYYSNMFIQGMGGIQIAKSFMSAPPQIQLSRGVSPDVKYEVSKGLALEATKKIRVPKVNMEAIEILGEDNFVITKASTYEEIPLSFDNAVTGKMMEHIGQYFQQIQPQNAPFACTKFADFALLFYQTSRQLFGLKLQQNDFLQGFKEMNINNYIMNLPEYRQAQNDKRAGGSNRFDYVAPIIIIEGMKFYDGFLLKKL